MIRILAYRFSAFGDVAMTVPVITEFLEQNPGVEIVMVSRSNFKELFHGIPNLIFKGINIDDYNGIIGINKLSKQLKNEFKPDYIADLHDVIRTKLLNVFFKLNGQKVFVLDKGKEEKKKLTDIQNLEKNPLKRTTERYADVFRAMGFTVNLSHQYRSVSSEKSGTGFAPFAQHEGKMLPLEKSFELATLIAKQEKLYFFGGG